MKTTDNPDESEVRLYLPKRIKEKIEEIESRQKEMDWTKTIDPCWQKILTAVSTCVFRANDIELGA
jgi:hypothetical protein